MTTARLPFALGLSKLWNIMVAAPTPPWSNIYIIDEAEKLTPQQIAAKEIEMEQRRVEQKKAKYYEAKHLDFQEWQETRRRYSAAFDPV